MYILLSYYFRKTGRYNGNVIDVGESEVVKALIDTKNRKPVRYNQLETTSISSVPTLKNNPPAKSDKKTPCVTLALINNGFLTIFLTFLIISVLKTTHLPTYFFLNKISCLDFYLICSITIGYCFYS